MTSPLVQMREQRRYILLALLLLLSMYVLLPQLSIFRTSNELLSHLTWPWLLAAIVFTLMTYGAAAATYCLLAFRSLPYAQVVLVQLGAMFINRLLPGGIGGLGANYRYLRHKKHSAAQAAAVVATNNLMGALGHGLLVVVALILFGRHGAISPASGWSFTPMYQVIAGIIIMIVIVSLFFGKPRLRRAILAFRFQLQSYRSRPGHLLGALMTSMLLTLGNVLSLWACAAALGLQLSFLILLLVFSFGLSAGTATPTPGGIGGFETGLVVGLVAYHISPPVALAVALLYRLVSYWLPLIIGGGAFVVAQRRHLFTT